MGFVHTNRFAAGLRTGGPALRRHGNGYNARMGLFEKLGRMAGRAARKGKWIYQSLAGDDKDAARAEYAVGYDLAQQTRSQLQMDEDAETGTPVKGVGRALAKWVNHAERRFSFQVYVAPDVNAFALPGGFIFLSRPIVQMCLGRQDELAFILGHEMAHVVRGHVLDRMIWGTLVNAASNAVRVAGPVAGVIRSAAATYVQRSYSRDQELEADILGVRLMRAAGFEPEGAVRLLEHLREVVPRHESAFSKYFGTHPQFDDRIDHLRRFLRRALPR